MIAPGADSLVKPLPNKNAAIRIPNPGPGFVSTKKKIDFPVSAT